MDGSAKQELDSGVKSLPKLLCAITLLSMSGLVWAFCPEGYREHDRTGECKKIPGWVVVNPTTVQSMSDERLCEITRPGWRHISSEVQALKGEGQKA